MEGRVRKRIWRRDHTVRKPDPLEIADRLGWLASPQAVLPRISEIRKSFPMYELTLEGLEKAVQHLMRRH
jgi:hypothetical protein